MRVEGRKIREETEKEKGDAMGTYILNLSYLYVAFSLRLCPCETTSEVKDILRFEFRFRAGLQIKIQDTQLN